MNIPDEAIQAAERAIASEPGGWAYLARAAVEAAAPFIAAAERERISRDGPATPDELRRMAGRAKLPGDLQHVLLAFADLLDGGAP
jgi:hypothetical protein